jgi:hypothetical protein
MHAGINDARLLDGGERALKQRRVASSPEADAARFALFQGTPVNARWNQRRAASSAEAEAAAVSAQEMISPSLSNRASVAISSSRLKGFDK